MVTETDQAVEAYIKDSIAQTYPDFCFIGEESYAGGERVELTDEPTFIVDPIDGTTNFVSPGAERRATFRSGVAGADSVSLPCAGPWPRLCALQIASRLAVFKPECVYTLQVCCSIGFTYKQEPVIG